MPEHVRTQIRSAEFGVNKLDSVPPGSIPDELSQPALGKFPLLEQGLKTKGSAIPNEWSMENVLAAVSVGTSTILRQEAGLAPESPDQVLLILPRDNDKVGVQDEELGHSMVEYEVDYPDKTTWHGKIRMPGLSAQQDPMSGIPLASYRGKTELDLSEEPGEAIDEKNLVDEHLQQFTPLGVRLISFLAGAIYSYNRYTETLRKG